MPIASIFLHSFYIVVSYLGGIVPWPPLETPCRNQRHIKKEDLFFRDHYVFETKKFAKLRLIQSFSLIIQSSVVSIKCRFDQVSFRSNVVRSSIVRSSVVQSTVGSRDLPLIASWDLV